MVGIKGTEICGTEEVLGTQSELFALSSERRREKRTRGPGESGRRDREILRL